MSGDEVLVLFISLALAASFWWKWYLSLILVRGGRQSNRKRYPLIFLPWLCGYALFFLLKNYSAHDVRNDDAYIFFYLTMGAGWLALGTLFLSYFGLSQRDDVCERGNGAAAWALGGGLIGIMACFAGANIGDGPGWWCVAFAAALASAALFSGWYLMNAWGAINESVTVDRDQASGIRLGAYLAASGLILGRGAAGNWTSALQTVLEFSAAWPFVPLTALAIMTERTSRPTPERPFGPVFLHGFVPGALYLLTALFSLKTAGPVP